MSCTQPIASTNSELLYWHLSRTEAGQIQGQARRVALTIAMDDSVLFRLLLTPSKNLEMQKIVADQFARMSLDEEWNGNGENAVVGYLKSFFSKVIESCDVATPDLRIREKYHGSELDFPRSSASWMMMREFCKHLRAAETLADRLRPFLARWQ